jgi:hypothetical protein
LQNTAYPEIVFCCIARIFAYFILPHIVLYFIFHRGFLVTIVSHRAHKDALFFCLYFFSCQVHYVLFYGKTAQSLSLLAEHFPCNYKNLPACSLLRFQFVPSIVGNFLSKLPTLSRTLFIYLPFLQTTVYIPHACSELIW